MPRPDAQRELTKRNASCKFNQNAIEPPKKEKPNSAASSLEEDDSWKATAYLAHMFLAVPDCLKPLEATRDRLRAEAGDRQTRAGGVGWD
jgi:hypothetical protein